MKSLIYTNNIIWAVFNGIKIVQSEVWDDSERKLYYLKCIISCDLSSCIQYRRATRLYVIQPGKWWYTVGIDNDNGYLLRELSLHSADVFLLHLPVTDLVFHLPRLLGGPSEQQQSARQPIQAVDRAQVLQVVLLRQDEHHRVVTVPAARMYLDRVRALSTAASKLKVFSTNDCCRVKQ